MYKTEIAFNLKPQQVIFYNDKPYRITKTLLANNGRLVDLNLRNEYNRLLRTTVKSNSFFSTFCNFKDAINVHNAQNRKIKQRSRYLRYEFR